MGSYATNNFQHFRRDRSNNAKNHDPEFAGPHLMRWFIQTSKIAR
jgi:hypothetical protein